MNVRSINIAPRAFLCFGAITCLLVALGVFSYTQLNQLRRTEQLVENDLLPSIQTGDDLQIALLHARLESIRLLATSDSAGHTTALANLNAAKKQMDERTAFYRKNFVSEPDDVIKFEQAADYFTHLTIEIFQRKVLAGQIKIPITRLEPSQKSAKGIHITDLANYLDEQREAALKECRQLNGAFAVARR
jgi:CHASE3 domain sensor protein